MGRASRHVLCFARPMDDRSSNGAPALAALQPVRRGQTLPDEREGQGQCERPARRRLADLPMHDLRRHLEPADPGASAVADALSRVPRRAHGQRPGADASPGVRRRGAEAAGGARRAFSRCPGDQGRAVEELFAAAPAKNLCSVPAPTGLRLDRLLGNELQLSRSFLQGLERRGWLVVRPPGSRLRRPVRKGMEVVVTLSALGDAGLSIAANAQVFPTRPGFPDMRVSENGD